MKVDDSKENEARCICPNCPTHDECMQRTHAETLYCARGKSKCEINKKGCLCGECPVAADYQLTDLYFCETGQAK